MDGVLVAQGTALASISGANPLRASAATLNSTTLAYLNGLIDEVLRSTTGACSPTSDIATIFAQRAASQSAQAATITGNVIGTNLGGSAPLANGSGVVIDSSIGALVGGLTSTPGTGAGNLISGNAGDGVLITGLASGNVVEGNLIGTDSLGTSAIGNGNDGVDIASGASNNTIGGTTASARNVIDSNSGDGVAILGVGVTGNVVSGNYIGLKADNSGRLQNATYQVFVQANGNTIGGTTSGQRINVIAPRASTASSSRDLPMCWRGTTSARTPPAR